MPRYVPGLLFGLAAFGLLRARGAENVSVDGKLVASIADSHYTAGRIGLASSQGLIRVKDIHLVGTPAKLQKPWRASCSTSTTGMTRFPNTTASELRLFKGCTSR